MTTTIDRSPARAETGARPGRGFRATLSSSVGFTLDFYDMCVAVFVAPVIATLFFPGDNKALSLAGAFSTLAATLLMRPIGAAVMGSIADRFGRRRAMIIALFGVGAVTCAIGALPVEASAGVIAPVLLLVLRLAQGMFVGGVFASTLTMAIETVRPRWRGLVSGIVGGGGTTVGSVLASLALFLALQGFPGDQFAAWGWRAMFFAGGLPVVLSLVLVVFLEESPMWDRDADKTRRPVREVLGAHRKLLLLNMPVVFGIATHFLLTLGFLPTYLQVVNHLPPVTVSGLLVVVNLLTLAFGPLVGHLSQLYGRKRVMIAVAVLNTIALPVLFQVLAGLSGPQALVPVVVVTVAMSCLSVGAFGPMPVFLNQRFPTAVRASGVALSINFSFALAGLVPTLVNAWSGGVANLTAFVMGALVIGGLATVVGLLAVPEPARDLD